MTTQSEHGQRLIGASAAVSALLVVVLGGAYLAFNSELALAQAADSVADVLTAGALLWAVRLSQEPADENHPFGHQGAQPLAALVVAVLAGVLAAQVLREAVTALTTDHQPTVTWPLLSALGAKVALKTALASIAWSLLRRRPSAALHAFLVDARNDVLIGATSVMGLLCSVWFGMPSLDAWLAVPVSLWIGWSGITLGLENANLLMGVMPEASRVDALRAIASASDGVVRVHSLKARHHGNEIHLWLEIRVDPELTVRAAHDVGEAVEQRLLLERDVCHVDVHVDAA